MADDRSVLDAKMQDYGRERTTGFLLKDYYVVFAEPRTKGGDKPLPHLDEKEHKRIFDEHIAHQVRLEEAGQLFAAGPLLDENGKRVGGLIILRANSFEEARKIVDSGSTSVVGIVGPYNSSVGGKRRILHGACKIFVADGHRFVSRGQPQAKKQRSEDR